MIATMLIYGIPALLFEVVIRRIAYPSLRRRWTGLDVTPARLYFGAFFFIIVVVACCLLYGDTGFADIVSGEAYAFLIIAVGADGWDLWHSAEPD